MTEDIQALVAFTEALKELGELSEKTNKDNVDTANVYIELGKYISDLEHKVEMLEEENVYLRMMLKDKFGGIT